MSDDVKRWIVAEAEPLFFPNISSQQVIQVHIVYPDIISGVLDCVANMALLTIGRILRSLCHARLRWSTQPEQTEQSRRESSQLMDSPETIEQRRQRAMTAFDFVRGKSCLAAKPLEFGLRQVHSSGFSDPVDILDGREGNRGFGLSA